MKYPNQIDTLFAEHLDGKEALSGINERNELDGVMASSSFRNGEVRIIFFNPPKTIK